MSIAVCSLYVAIHSSITSRLIPFFFCFFFFFFNDTATTEIYTLSLHDALPIFDGTRWVPCKPGFLLPVRVKAGLRSEEHTSELQSLRHLVCRLLLEKKKKKKRQNKYIITTKETPRIERNTSTQ